MGRDFVTPTQVELGSLVTVGLGFGKEQSRAPGRQDLCWQGDGGAPLPAKATSLKKPKMTSWSYFIVIGHSMIV
jgi:hypothetical protein